jgi:hypothetical protein
MFKYNLIILLGLLLWGCSNVEVKKEYFPNGKLKSEKQYRNGKLNGESKEFYNNGTLLKRENWMMGIRDTVEYYVDDTVNTRIIFDTEGNRLRTYAKIFNKDKGFELLKDGEVLFARLYLNTWAPMTVGDSVTINIVLFSGRLNPTINCNVIIGKQDTLTYKIIKEYQNSPMLPDQTLKYSFVPSHPGMDTLEGEVRISDEKLNSKPKHYPFRTVFSVKSK